MAQLTITRENTPSTLIIRLHQDPFDPGDFLLAGATVTNLAGEVLAAHALVLRDVEADFADSLVQAVVECYRFGSPQQDLAPVMRRIKREATRHLRRHRR